MFIAEKIKKCRTEAGISQETMMFDLDKEGLRISRTTLCNWETGDTTPDANEIAVIAKFFKKPIQYFFA